MTTASPDPTLPAAPLAVPHWAVPHAPPKTLSECAFFAGAALATLDAVVHSAPPWAGAWRQRLALTCSRTGVQLAGRAEDEAALRDHWHLRLPGAALGPAGSVLWAWRQLVTRSPHLDEVRLRAIAELLGTPWRAAYGELPDRLDALIASGAPAPAIAATVIGWIPTPPNETPLLGWWLADLALARRLRWPLPVPLMLAPSSGPAFKSANAAGLRPDNPEVERAAYLAVGHGAVLACRLATDLSRRAARLRLAAPKLRAKGAGEAIARLLDDDAVPGSLQTANLSRWGARRLFERLLALGAIQELTGRSTFRLYGL